MFLELFPAKRVKRLVAFHHRDAVRRILQLHQNRKVQARRAAADTKDIHGF